LKQTTGGCWGERGLRLKGAFSKEYSNHVDPGPTPNKKSHAKQKEEDPSIPVGRVNGRKVKRGRTPLLGELSFIRPD